MAAPTRRALFGGAVAVAAMAAPAITVAAQVPADHQLARLISAYEATLAAVEVAEEELLQAHRRLDAARPPVPAAMQLQPLDRHYGWKHPNCRLSYIGDLQHVRQMQALYGAHSPRAERGTELIAAIGAYNESVDRAREASGVAEWVDAYDRARKQEDAALEAILDHRASTLAGLQAKAAVAARFIDDQDELGSFGSTWAQAILNDIRTMESV